MSAATPNDIGRRELQSRDKSISPWDHIAPSLNLLHRVRLNCIVKFSSHTLHGIQHSSNVLLRHPPFRHEHNIASRQKFTTQHFLVKTNRDERVLFPPSRPRSWLLRIAQQKVQIVYSEHSCRDDRHITDGGALTSRQIDLVPEIPAQQLMMG